MLLQHRLELQVNKSKEACLVVTCNVNNSSWNLNPCIVKLCFSDSKNKILLWMCVCVCVRTFVCAFVCVPMPWMSISLRALTLMLQHTLGPFRERRSEATGEQDALPRRRTGSAVWAHGSSCSPSAGIKHLCPKSVPSRHQPITCVHKSAGLQLELRSWIAPRDYL